MKSIFAGSAVLIVASMGFAQPEPSFVGMPVITAFSGTTCTYCGTWGWTQFKDHISKYTGKAVLIKNNGSSLDGGTPMLRNEWSNSLTQISGVTGFPAFYVNGAKQASSEAVSSVSNAHIAKKMDVGMNFEAAVVGSDIRVIRHVKTNGPVTGKFELNTVVIENKVQATQTSLSGVQSHSFIHRRSSSLYTASSKGTTLPAAALSGNHWKDTVFIPIAPTNGINWKMNDISIALMLFKNGVIYNGYTRENAFTTFPVAISQTTKEVRTGIQLKGLTLAIGNEIANGVVRVMGFNGRLVAEQSISAGSTLDLRSLNLSRGVYMVSVNGRNFVSPTTRFMID